MTKLFASVLVPICVFSTTATAQYRDGELDDSFGVNGVNSVTYLDNDFGYDVVATSDGTIIVVGSSEDIDNPNGRDARAIMYDVGGNQLGSRTYPHGEFGCADQPDAFYAGALEPAGTVIAGGFAQFACGNGSIRDFYIVRFAANGDELARFDRPVFHGVQENIWALDVQSDGRIVAAGFADTNPSDPATRDVAVARYNNDGTLDQSFGTGGEVLIDVSGDYDWAYGLAIDTSGRILVSGFTRVDGQFDYLLVGLDNTGARDSTFGNLGIVTTDVGGFDDVGNDVVVQRDGKPIVVGNQTDGQGGTKFTVVRYNDNGTLDDTFGINGVATVPFGSDRSAARKVMLQKDCKILASGFARVDEGDESSDMIAVARLHSDGSLDSTFNDPTGRRVIDVAAAKDDYTSGIATLPGGNLVIAGHSADRSDQDETWDVALASVINDNVVFFGSFEYCP